MANRYKLNQKHLRYFRDRVKYWQHQLGLLDIDFECVLKEHIDPGVRAEYGRWSKSSFVEIILSEHWGVYPSYLQLDSSAFHEVFESGYLSELRAMAKSTYSDYEVEYQTHQAVRKAENTIFIRLR